MQKGMFSKVSQQTEFPLSTVEIITQINALKGNIACTHTIDPFQLRFLVTQIDDVEMYLEGLWRAIERLIERSGLGKNAHIYIPAKVDESEQK